MQQPSFASITLKTTLVHTVTYFITGFFAFTLLDYGAKYADPVVAGLMRQTNHPLVAAGPALQVLRGFLFGLVFYALREITFPRKRGWLTLWLVLGIVGILSPFGPSPSSIEGAIYTILPAWFGCGAALVEVEERLVAVERGPLRIRAGRPEQVVAFGQSIEV